MMSREAWAAMQENRLILVDVRRQSEWKQTGVAPGAITLTMGSDGFYERLEAIAAENPGKAIGLICAAGGRSTAVARELEARGLKQVVDVDDGMLGGLRSTGWIEAGLPRVPWVE
jgi:rhodanese-related sulfurtransferase